VDKNYPLGGSQLSKARKNQLVVCTKLGFYLLSKMIPKHLLTRTNYFNATLVIEFG